MGRQRALQTAKTDSGNSNKRHSGVQPSLFHFWDKNSKKPKKEKQREDEPDDNETHPTTLPASPQWTVVSPEHNEVKQVTQDAFSASADSKTNPVSSSVSATSAQSQETAEEAGDESSGEESLSDSDKEPTNDKEWNTPVITGLSEYELLRLKNIARNNARLAELGLLVLPKPERFGAPNKKRQRPRRPAKPQQLFNPPRRSSRRIRGLKQDSVVTIDTSDETCPTNTNAIRDAAVAEQPVEEEYQVSPVIQYAMDDKDKHGDTNNTTRRATSKSQQQESVSSLSLMKNRLCPPQGLGAIYSMQFYPTTFKGDGNTDAAAIPPLWLVGAGKAGIVALWDCHKESRASDDKEGCDGFIDPVLSWKAHSGRWISSAHFLPTNRSAASSNLPSRLLTAANDGCVCLWDLTTVSVSTGSPKLQCRTGKELHSSGIFAMDVNIRTDRDVLIATGSKDKSVAVSALESMESGCVLWRSDFHSAKVSAVQFQSDSSTTVLASASDDGLVAIHDCKDGSRHPSAVFEDSHHKPHSVVWDPHRQHFLLTAGLDSEMKLWDIRNLSIPLSTYFGHVPIHTGKHKKIHHPTFFNPHPRSGETASFILSGGQSSNSLSMFQYNPDITSTSPTQHPVYSRGKVPVDCGDVGSISAHGDWVAASVDGGEVLLLRPSVT